MNRVKLEREKKIRLLLKDFLELNVLSTKIRSEERFRRESKEDEGKGTSGGGVFGEVEIELKEGWKIGGCENELIETKRGCQQPVESEEEVQEEKRGGTHQHKLHALAAAAISCVRIQPIPEIGELGKKRSTSALGGDVGRWKGEGGREAHSSQLGSSLIDGGRSPSRGLVLQAEDGSDISSRFGEVLLGDVNEHLEREIGNKEGGELVDVEGKKSES